MIFIQENAIQNGCGISLNENDYIKIQIWLTFVPKGPVMLVAWRRTGNKPFPKPIITQFTNVYINGLMQEIHNSIANVVRSFSH